MNIKKTIVVSFVLFVTMCMVAHSVVAHHHNETTHSVVAHNECHEHDCEHETDSNNDCCTIENCLLSDFFTFTHSYKCTKHTSLSFNSFYIPVNYHLPKLTDYAGFDFREKPYVLHFYSAFIAQFNGLRAPPTC
ncbi:MAG: hypothetical protein LBR55_07320 [Bacteroidales bacterium]|nr:hypothetical protein [Bacteroidales bacterium]